MTAPKNIRNALPDQTDPPVTVGAITGPITPGTGPTDLGKAEDGVAANGDTGLVAFGRRNDAGATTISADGRYGVPWLTPAGAMVIAGFDPFGLSPLPWFMTDNGAGPAGLVQFDPNANVVSFGAARFPIDQSSSFETFTTVTNGSIGTLSNALKFFSLQVTPTGAVTSWDVRLEGGIDGVGFTTLIQHTTVDGAGITKFQSMASPILSMRLRCAALTLGAGTNVVCSGLGIQ